MRKLNVVLADLAYFNRYTINRNYIPLGAGYIASYATQLYGRDIDIKIFKDPVRLLEYVRSNRADVVGLSLYHWNYNLTRMITEKIRKVYKDEAQIVLGGPCIDVVEEEQKKIFERFPSVNAIIENEGEIGFSNFIKEIQGSRTPVWTKPVDGVSFMRNGELVKGKSVGLSIDLATVQSPYLNGFMEPFINDQFRPVIQTSRGCPYSCLFCAEGKNHAKLRNFPLEQVKEEVAYIARRYAGRTHFLLYIADDNFGIYPRDVHIAEHIKKVSNEIGYPKSMFFYNDKKLTEHGKKILETLSDLNQIGLTISLQSENPETLRAIGRTNISEEEIGKAIQWASERNISSSTELIFGLPYETKQSFIDLLNASIKRGFDSILFHSLFIKSGMAINRKSYREKFGLDTKFRLTSSNYTMIEDEFCYESEEVVVSTDSFTFDDYIEIRKLSFMFVCVYTLDLYKYLFNLLATFDVPVVNIFRSFIAPDRAWNWPDEYLAFIDDLEKAFLSELSPTEEGLKDKLRKLYMEYEDVYTPARINIYFGSRLIYAEKWFADVIKMQLEEYSLTSEQRNLIGEAILVCERVRIDLMDIKPGISMDVNYDFIAWKKDKYLSPINRFNSPKRAMLSIRPDVRKRLLLFKNENSHLNITDFYYNAFDVLVPRSNLLYDLSYEDNTKGGEGCSVAADKKSVNRVRG